MLLLSFLILCVHYSLTQSCFFSPSYSCVFIVLWHYHAFLVLLTPVCWVFSDTVMLFLSLLLCVQYSLTLSCSSSLPFYSAACSVFSDIFMCFFSFFLLHCVQFSNLWYCHALLLVCVQYSLTLSCPSSPLCSVFFDTVLPFFSSVFIILWPCYAPLLSVQYSMTLSCSSSHYSVFSIIWLSCSSYSSVRVQYSQSLTVSCTSSSS